MLRVISTVILVAMCGLALSPAHTFLSKRPHKIIQIGALGKYEKVNLVSCANNICIEVKSDEAVHGLLGNVSIKKASVFIQDQNSKNSIAKFKGSAFYDARFGRIYFTGISNSKFKEAYFDQQNGKFYKM